MEDIKRLIAVESIRRSKARYVYGADNNDWEMFASAFSEEAVWDLRGFCVARLAGSEKWNSIGSSFDLEFLEQLSDSGGWPVVGRQAIRSAGENAHKLVISSFHALFNPDITFTSDNRADVIWPFVETIHFSDSAMIKFLNAQGYYLETYVDDEKEWLIDRVELKPMQVTVS